MNLNSVKKHHFASVLPQLLSTHLTSSFNIRLVQIWPRTFPLCNVVQLETFPCGYWKTQENNQNVPIFVGGEGGKI